MTQMQYTPTVLYVSFSYIYILLGSVATQLRCAAIFTRHHFIAIFQDSVTVKIVSKSANIWQIYGQFGFGRRRFAVAGPSTWNSLPDSLRDPELSLNTFKRQLKTYVFTRY